MPKICLKCTKILKKCNKLLYFNNFLLIIYGKFDILILSKGKTNDRKEEKNMKKYIRKELKKLGRTYSQLCEGLRHNNFITRELLLNALIDMKYKGEVTKCYGGYYMLNS